MNIHKIRKRNTLLLLGRKAKALSRGKKLDAVQQNAESMK
jgi:hypothetical protein